MFRLRIDFKYLALYFFGSVILLTACGKKSMEGMIIITESLSKQEKRDYITGEGWRYFPQARLVAIDPSKPDQSPVILTSGFYSANSPEVSYDGTQLLFAGQKNQNDTWQIWEMDLGNSKVRQVTNSSDNSIDPAYLPGGKIVFSKSVRNDSLKAGHTLFTCNLDGSDLKRITFNPHSYFASTVLMDGRILTVSRQVYPEKAEPSFMVLRPDGTKCELFYKGNENSEISGRGWENGSGIIIFTETSENGSGFGKIISIKYNRPLHSKIDLTSSSSGDYRSVYPVNSRKLLVSYRRNEQETYSLYEFDSDRMVLGDRIYSSEIGDILEAVVVTVHERPRKLPSEVDTGVKTGLLLCQNINVKGMESPSGKYSFPYADRIEIIGIDSSLGAVKVEKDGSFYLKVSADMPFRIRTMNTGGEVINGPGSWYWLRPNERRGCVGCHEDQELTPANRYSLAVDRQPIAVPVHVTGFKEKEIELE